MKNLRLPRKYLVYISLFGSAFFSTLAAFAYEQYLTTGSIPTKGITSWSQLVAYENYRIFLLPDFYSASELAALFLWLAFLLILGPKITKYKTALRICFLLSACFLVSLIVTQLGVTGTIGETIGAPAWYELLLIAGFFGHTGWDRIRDMETLIFALLVASCSFWLYYDAGILKAIMKTFQWTAIPVLILPIIVLFTDRGEWNNHAANIFVLNANSFLPLQQLTNEKLFWICVGSLAVSTGYFSLEKKFCS